MKALIVQSCELSKEIQVKRNPNFSEIDNNCRIVHGAWHQADPNIFYSSFAGKQCCAMALAFIVKSVITPPSEWTSSTINQNMIEGNALYKTVQLISDFNRILIPKSGYLYVKNFDVVKKDLRMFDASFVLRYERDPPIFGNLLDALNQYSIGANLVSALTDLIDEHSAGILIASDRSFAVISSCNKFYFCDSHNCGPAGEPNDLDGRACVIECDTIENLCNVCKRAAGCENEQFTLDYVDVAITQKCGSDSD